MTRRTDGTILGYDPGGNGKHGLAKLHITDGRPTEIEVGTHDHVADVIGDVAAADSLIGLGTDTLTCWSTARSGWRPADRWLRHQYPDLARGVLSPNGLSGSMAINGMALLLRIRKIHSGLPVTETHPKLLHHILFSYRYDYEDDAGAMDEALSLELSVPVCTQTDHEWDAALSTLAVLRGLDGTWPLDLHRLATEEGEELISPISESHYWWPETVASSRD